MTVPLSALTDTWNNGATVFNAIQMNVTDSGHAAGSKLLDLQIGGASKFNVDDAGRLVSSMLWVDTSVIYSCGIGAVAGNYSVVTGVANASVGQGAGSSLTTGGGNCCFGANVGVGLTTGTNNILIGSNTSFSGAGGSITTGSNNIIIGSYAGTTAMASQIVLAIGTGAVGLWTDLSGATYSAGIGGNAGHFGTASGTYNVSIGVNAGLALTTGGGNMLLGAGSGSSLTTGAFNTLVGGLSTVAGAGSSITTGSFNTIVGPYVGTAAMASQVVLADGNGNIVVQYDQPNKIFVTPTTTVASLPAAGTVGRRAFVTDANASTFFTVAAGSGSNKVPVFDDGTNWRIG